MTTDDSNDHEQTSGGGREATIHRDTLLKWAQDAKVKGGMMMQWRGPSSEAEVAKLPGAIGGQARDPSGKPLGARREDIAAASVRVIGIRATDAEHEMWQRAADARGITLAEWACVALNDLATRTVR